MFGSRTELLDNALGKADAHERHGIPNGEIIGRRWLHLLGAGDFAYGNSVDYKNALAGGSGLSVKQDGEVTMTILAPIIDQINLIIDDWLTSHRSGGRGHGWLNERNRAGMEFAMVSSLPVRRQFELAN